MRTLGRERIDAIARNIYAALRGTRSFPRNAEARARCSVQSGLAGAGGATGTDPPSTVGVVAAALLAAT